MNLVKIFNIILLLNSYLSTLEFCSRLISFLSAPSKNIKTTMKRRSKENGVRPPALKSPQPE